ncbi:MAG: hypothetical protein ACPLRM_03630 [Anaerolineae bacterium]
MSLIDPQDLDIFSIRVYKSYQGFTWANTYELACVDSSATYGDLTTAALVLVARERAFHFSWVQFDKVTISTYQPDGQPYNPTSFTAIELEVGGLRNPSSDSLPLDICLHVKRLTLTGRSGRHFYRGCLEETDVAFGGNRFLVSSERRNAVGGEVAGQLSSVQPLFQLVLARGVPTPTNVRQVIGATVDDKTATKRLDNRFFNQMTP